MYSSVTATSTISADFPTCCALVSAVIRHRAGLYGPPGLCRHVAGFIAGVHWDRIGDQGPIFRVAEVSDEAVDWFHVQPGRDPLPLGSEPAAGGVLLRQPGFRVVAATLDHGIPVLAFLLQLDDTLHVREGGLAARGLVGGPWLGTLKRHLAGGETDATVTLPDGRREAAGRLAEGLIDVVGGSRLAYATDFADSDANRRILGRLARRADLLICEATFLASDASRARETRHLTARACVEIAAAAEVEGLLPFHFSRRYTGRLAEMERELHEASRATALEGKLVGVPSVMRGYPSEAGERPRD